MYLTTETYKIIVILINVICVILGSLLTWFGTWLYQSVEDPKYDHGEELSSILVIALGVALICTAVYGTVVTILERKSWLIVFAVVLIVLLVIQMFMVSISYTSANVSERLKQGFEELWDPHYQRKNTTLSFYEEWLHCCGKNSPEDYFLLDKYPPRSCCKDQNCIIIHNLYKDGCEVKYRQYVESKTNNFNSLSWITIVTEFVGSIFACILIDSIRNHRDRQRFYG